MRKKDRGKSGKVEIKTWKRRRPEGVEKLSEK